LIEPDEKINILHIPIPLFKWNIGSSNSSWFGNLKSKRMRTSMRNGREDFTKKVQSYIDMQLALKEIDYTIIHFAHSIRFIPGRGAIAQYKKDVLHHLA
jgi:hypothetical protein